MPWAYGLKSSMQFIDTHTHPYDEAFDEDRPQVMQRAVDSGVARWIFPGIDSTSFAAQLDLYERWKSNAYMGMGLHPTSVGENWKDELQFALDELRAHPERYVAVGEIGLDAYWSRDYMAQQKEVLVAQLEYASEKDLPVIIHERSATGEMLDIMRRFKGRLSGVFHAFTGSLETYREIASLGGFKVGIGGVVTFKNAGIGKVVSDIPLSDILLETDSPYLTPAPYRGTRNESSYIPIIAAKVAEVKNIDIKEVAKVTTANAESLFHLPHHEDRLETA